MSTPIPAPLRAAAGLAAVAIDEARRLPDRLVGLPVLAVSGALQASLKVQQRYAELISRGDQLLGQLPGERDDTPPWARFDEDEAPVPPVRSSAFDAADDLADDELVAEALAAVEYPEPDAAGATAWEVDALGEVALAGGAGTPPPVAVTLAEAADEQVGGVPPPRVAPLPGYDELSIAQLRGRLRSLDADRLMELVNYERETAARPPYLTMLENRLATVRGR